MIIAVSHDLIIGEHCAPSMLLLRKVYALCKEREGLREGQMLCVTCNVIILIITDPRIAQLFEKLVQQLAESNVNGYVTPV